MKDLSKDKAPLLPRNVVNVLEFVGDLIESSSDVNTTPIKDRIELRKKDREEIMKSTLNDDFGNLLPEATPEVPSNLPQKKQDDGSSDDSEEDEDDGTLGIGKQISLYTKLPPPNVQILPFNFLTKKAEIEGEQNTENLGDEFDNLISNIQTRDDFENLKSRTNDYLDRLINLVDNLYGQNQNEYVVYHSSRSKKGNKVKKDQAKEQPTTIQFLKALDKANNIMEEVDRSRRETQLKKKIGIAHYQKM